jgi:hypothetical protein
MILIVIGILLALNINNWNEEQKTRDVETKILVEIKGNLNLDLEEVRKDIRNYKRVQISCDDILNFLKTEETPQESFYKRVGVLRVNPHFDPNQSGYGLLKSNGVEIVLNDTLRKAISDLYESDYSYYNRYEEELTQFRQLNVVPVMLKYFSWKREAETGGRKTFLITHEDYSLLRDDHAFRKVVEALKFEYNTVQIRAERIEGLIVDLINQLDGEL